MSQKNVFFGTPVTIPIAVGLILLAGILLMGDRDDTDARAAEFYEVKGLSMEKTSGLYQGTITNGTFVTVGDIINITAENESEPTSGSDVLVIDLNVTSDLGKNVYKVSLPMVYSGSGKDFWADLGIRNNLTSNSVNTSNGIDINISDGYRVDVMKHGENISFLHFFVDAAPPVIAPLEPSSSISHYMGRAYATTSATINIFYHDTDPAATPAWAASNGKVKYRWDSSSEQTWDGTDFAVPTSIGTHILRINATDRFGNHKNHTFSYTTSTTFKDQTVNTSVGYVNKTVLLSNIRIARGGSLDLLNCTSLFLEDGDSIVVEDGGYLNITGPSNVTLPAGSVVSTSGTGFTIFSLPGAHLSIAHSAILQSGTSSVSSALELWSGELNHTLVSGDGTLIWVRSIGALVNDTVITGTDDGIGLKVDVNHTYASDSTKLHNIYMNGTFDDAVRILNNSVWTPFDVDGNEIYYLDEGVHVINFVSPNSSIYSDPYLYFPHFLDSRSGNASLNIRYNNTGVWTDLPGFPKSGMTYDNWLNGKDARIDLSTVPDEVQIQIEWNVSGGGGVLYYSRPAIGGSNMDPILIDNSNFGGVLGDWFLQSNKAKGPTLDVLNLTIRSATSTFINISSSGMVNIHGLRTGPGSYGAEAPWQMKVVKSEMYMSDSLLMGNGNLSGFIKCDFANQNDWPTIVMENTTLAAPGEEVFTGIESNGTWLDLSEMQIRNVSYGVTSDSALFKLFKVDIEADLYGVYLELPDIYEEDVSIDVNGLTVRSDYQYSGLYMNGDISYDLDVSLGYLDLQSTYNSTSFERDDGIGALTVDLVSTRTADLVIYRSQMVTGPSHGLALVNWPYNGGFRINDSVISSMELDGVWMGTNISIEIDGCDLDLNNGYGLYGYEGADISLGYGRDKGEVWMNEEGGLLIKDGSTLTIDRYDIRNNEDYGVDMGHNVTATFSDTFIERNEYGVRGLSGCDVSFDRSVVKLSTLGSGIHLKDSDLEINGTEIAYSEISENGKYGLFMEGGTLSARYLSLKDNKGGDGMKLWGVDLRSAEHIISSGNRGAGIAVYVDDPSLLDSQGVYVKMEASSVSNNLREGLSVTFDPISVSGTIEMELAGFQAFGNGGGDIMAAEQVHFTWTAMAGKNSLGSKGYSGRSNANLDIIVHYSGALTIENENLTLLSSDGSIKVESNGFLYLRNAYIRPLDPSSRWSINALEGSNIDINGGYLGYLSQLSVENGNSLKMDGTLIRYGEGGLDIISTNFTIDSCQFSQINGFAVSLDDSTGTIRGSGFSDNTRGINVDYLEGALTIDDCTFTENSWGIFVFRSNQTSSSIIVRDSTFGDNGIAPIWMSDANVTLYNTEIDPSKIDVETIGNSASLFYTLTVNVVNEKGDNERFNIEVKLGGSATGVTSNDNIGPWSIQLKTYTVYKNGVDRSRETAYITISYLHSTGSEEIWSYISDSFVLDSRTTMTYNGYKAPFTTPDFQSVLLADEDEGLRDGPVDISTWFDDLGTDGGNLTFEVATLNEEVQPVLVGTTLSLDLKKDFNGVGELLITVTDPHGKKLEVTVTVNVLPTNDRPWITNARIISLNGEDEIPRSGDTLLAVWEWHDIDDKDTEPQRKYIHWFLNGTYIKRYGGADIDNLTTVPDVKAGEVWSYKVWPMDFESINFNIYGDPVMSSVVIIQNIGPRWTSNLTFETRTPTTDMDIIVTPGTYDDPDSSVVTFHYQWEVRKGERYVPLGAPDSPLLDHRFTRKNQDIRVKAWVSDGTSNSGIRMASFQIRNSPPVLLSAELSPKVLDEFDDVIYVINAQTYDADGDSVRLYYSWIVGNNSIAANNEIPQLSRSQGGWSYLGNNIIEVTITPFDSDNIPGKELKLIAQFIPTDTDGDGKPNDLDGDGKNDAEDDDDDDGDHFLDEWELLLGSDPLNPLDRPLDTDGDGIPDGSPGNPYNWMDTDDDNDGIPDSEDTYPKNGALPGDFDHDGIGDDRDNDIDGDNVVNRNDYDPWNPNVQHAPKEPSDIWGILIFIFILIILVALIAAGYLVYTGKFALPSAGPPGIAEEGAEAIFEEEEEGKASREKEEEMDLEELESMSVCSVCGELVSLDETRCPNCGAVFEELEEMEEDYEEIEFEEDE